jgi:hypothetical protein
MRIDRRLYFEFPEYFKQIANAKFWENAASVILDGLDGASFVCYGVPGSPGVGGAACQFVGSLPQWY